MPSAPPPRRRGLRVVLLVVSAMVAVVGLGREFGHDKLRIAITTAVSLVIWGLCFAVISSDWFSFRSGALALPKD